ncbi:MAG: hypothetical protein ACR2IJ_03560 [Fluviibacter sp.]
MKEKTMINFPLSEAIMRCLGHGHPNPRETCLRADRCAAHVTIRFDKKSVPVAERICRTPDMAGFIPLDSFVEDDVQ